jgi:hypothetical protein
LYHTDKCAHASFGLTNLAASSRRFASFAAALVLLGLGAGYTGVPLASAHERSGYQQMTFVGLVTTNPDSRDQREKYIVRDENGMMNYFLYDSGKAAKSDEMRVRIVGTLNHSNTTIHVDSIEPLGGTGAIAY